MDFSLNDQHLDIQRAAGDFLHNEIDLARLLVPGATYADFDSQSVWRKFVEMGWPGAIIPEEFGGLGLSCLDLHLIVSETGRVLAPAPLFGTVSGVWALLAAGTAEQKQTLLPKVAGDGLSLALAVCDKSGQANNSDSDAVATIDDDWCCIDGSKSFVVDAGSAGQLIVAAQVGSKRGLFLVDSEQAGVTIVPVAWRDVTRDVCRVEFNQAKAEVMVLDDCDAWPWVRDRVLLMLASESAAGLQWALNSAADYARQRVAFGKPIGAYQAIKHQLASMFCTSECASVATLYAAWALAANTTDASEAVAAAKAYACEAFVEATHRNIQIHGAIGFTWEMSNHLYFKRARANAEMLGSSTHHRARLMGLVETRLSAA